MGDLRERLPKPKPGQKAKYQDELVMLHELVQVSEWVSEWVSERMSEWVKFLSTDSKF